MASGDRQRTWFPEMIDALRAGWRADMSWVRAGAQRPLFEHLFFCFGSRRDRHLLGFIAGKQSAEF